MAQPRYNATLQEFVRRWRPNVPELDAEFMKDVTALVAAILVPPANVFEVETILTPDGGKVVVRLADYEAQLDPLDSQHLGLSLIEAATSARTESWLYKFLTEEIAEPDIAAMMIAKFRHYRITEMQGELDGELEKRDRPVTPREGT